MGDSTNGGFDVANGVPRVCDKQSTFPAAGVSVPSCTANDGTQCECKFNTAGDPVPEHSSASRSQSADNHGTVIGLAVAAGILGVLLLVAVVVIVMMRQRNAQNKGMGSVHFFKRSMAPPKKEATSNNTGTDQGIDVTVR